VVSVHSQRSCHSVLSWPCDWLIQLCYQIIFQTHITIQILHTVILSLNLSYLYYPGLSFVLCCYVICFTLVHSSLVPVPSVTCYIWYSKGCVFIAIKIMIFSQFRLILWSFNANNCYNCFNTLISVWFLYGLQQCLLFLGSAEVIMSRVNRVSFS
jgi:hypothetical protein